MKTFPLALTLALLAVSASAFAAEPSPAPSFDVGLRAGFVSSSAVYQPIGVAGGIDAHYHLRPWLRLGLYLQHATVKSGSSDHDSYGDHWTATRAGIRTELHALPALVVDPFLGFGFGGFLTSDRNTTFRQSGEDSGLDTELNAGVDFRVMDHLTLGAIFTLTVPLTNRAAFRGLDENGSNLSFSGIGNLPLPMFRASFAF